MPFLHKTEDKANRFHRNGLTGKPGSVTKSNSPMSDRKEYRMSGPAGSFMENGRRKATRGVSYISQKQTQCTWNYCLHTGGFDSGIFRLLWFERVQPSSLGKRRHLSYYRMVLPLLHRHSNKTYIPSRLKCSKRRTDLKKEEPMRRGSVTSPGARGSGHHLGHTRIPLGQRRSGSLHTRSPSRFLSKLPSPLFCRSGWRSTVMSCCSLLREQVLLSR